MPDTAQIPLTQSFPGLLLSARAGRRVLDGLEQTHARAREFAETHVRPRAMEIDRLAGSDPNHFPWEVVRAGLAYRMLSVLIPRQAGGVGGLLTHGVIVMEELCAACPGIANIFGAHALGACPLLVTGSIGHWDGLLREIADAELRGEPILMALAITEPEAGTDVEDTCLMRRARITSAARRVPGGYRLSGAKRFISNGSVARWITVFMPTDPRDPADTWTCFLLDSRSEGFSVSRVEHKMGQRACPAAELALDEVFVPDEAVIGRPGDGMPITLMTMATSRPGVAAIATGTARGAYERLLAWLQSTSDGGRLLERQHVQLALAEMHEEIHLARQAYMDAALVLDLEALGGTLRHPMMRLYNRIPVSWRRARPMRSLLSTPAAREAAASFLRRKTDARTATRSLAISSMAKARGADVAMRVSRRALEVVGLTDDPVRAELQKLWRDAKLTQIYEGTNQLNRLEVHRGLCAGDVMEIVPSARHRGAA